MDYKNKITHFDESIRRGLVGDVQKAIESLSYHDIPREFVVAFADLARRVRAEDWGIQLLQPFVRPLEDLNLKISQPSPEELCAYAGLLIKIGALNEAHEILIKLDPKKILNTLVFRSQIAIAEWDYQSAADALIELLNFGDVDDYQKCVARLNLSAAYVFLRQLDQAEEILKIVRTDCEKNNWNMLWGNSLEISAQAAVTQKNWGAAAELLQQAELRVGQHRHYQMFIQKWRLVSDLMRTDLSDPFSSKLDELTADFEELRNQAISLNSWETVRDLDFYQALCSKHQNLLLNVYFGTPHYQYKKRIESIFRDEGWTLPKSYIRKISNSPASRFLNLETGLEPQRTLHSSLIVGDINHQLLSLLATDFYKPRSLGDVFSALFETENYHPQTSAQQVLTVVEQLRSWFQENEIPLDVLIEKNRYSIIAHRGYAFQMSRQMAAQA